MITKELTDYIKAERAAGIADDAIKQSLVAGGWSVVDAQEAFNSLNAAPAPASVVPPAAAPVQAQPASKLAQTFKPVQSFASAPSAVAKSPVMTMPTSAAAAAAAMAPVQAAPKAKKGGGGLLIFLIILLLLGGAGAYAYMNDMIPFLSGSAELQDNLLVPVQSVEQTASVSTSTAVEAPVAAVPAATVPTSTPSVVATTTTPAATSSQSASINLWPIVTAYVTALKNKDLAAVNAVSYAKVATATAALYDDVTSLRESDFTSRVQDGRQAIYSSLMTKEGSATSTSFTRNVLIFVKDGDAWKVIKEPKRIWSVPKTATSSDSQIEAQLQAMSYDADKDGLTDFEEACAAPRVSGKQCVKTDPAKMDTNGDGWWDGVEIKFTK
ncbi:MAG TPA: hypothetical protein VGE35_03955 [Candidatus Paceibacterota bacterium]